MSDAEILFETRGRVGLVTLSRPKALNALTHGMCVAMHATLKQWADDPAIEYVTVQGEGDRAFCAGGDIRALHDSGKAGTPYALQFWHDEYRLNSYIAHYPKPYIALIHGIVMGGGVGLSVHGGYRIADEATTFAMPETGIGLFPDVGGSHFLPRLPGELGMYLAMTGTRFKSADTLYAGVATHYMPAGNNATFLERLEAGETPEGALEGLCSSPGPAPVAEYRQRIDAIFSAHSVEGILERLERDATDWALDTAKAMRTKSPTSMKITFREVREGKTKNIDECLKMEYRMAAHVAKGHDFYEGVRATIIDKDGAPKWKPASLAEVSEADVASYFAPVERELSL